MHIIFGISTENCTGEHTLYQKRISYKYSTTALPQVFSHIILPVLPLNRVSTKKLFLIKCMFSGAVFCADSEYDMHFILELIFDDDNLRIPTHFSTFLI